MAGTPVRERATHTIPAYKTVQMAGTPVRERQRLTNPAYKTAQHGRYAGQGETQKSQDNMYARWLLYR